MSTLINILLESSEKIRIEYSGGYGNWSYMHIYYYVGEREEKRGNISVITPIIAAYIDFQLNEDDKEIYIEMIEVSKEYRRRGIATKMLNMLRSEYPDYYVDWGYTLEDGTKLKDALTTTEENPEYTKLKQELDSVSARKLEIERFLDNLFSDDEQDESNRDLIDEYGEEWDRLHHREWELQNELSDIRQYITVWK